MKKPTLGKGRRRILRFNHKSEIPTNLLFVDTETSEQLIENPIPTRKLSFHLGCCKHVRIESGEIRSESDYDFDTIREFWEIAERLQQPKKPLWVFSHNLVFDMTILRLWDRIEEGEYRIEFPKEEEEEEEADNPNRFKSRIVLEDRCSYLKLLGRKGTVWFCDSMNYFPMSLAKIGKSIGLEKGNYEESKDQRDHLLSYCRQDVKILATAVVQTMLQWSSLDSGNWQPTAAQLSLSAFRHHQEKDSEGNPRYPITLDESPEPSEYEREGFFGGYCSPFYLGYHPDKCYYVDVHGLYPYVMRNSNYPTKRLNTFGKIEPKQLLSELAGVGAMADVIIHSHERPYIVRYNGELLYCTGTFKTRLCGDELLSALELGHVLEVHGGIRYSVAPIFRNFVDEFHGRLREARKQGNAKEASLLKLVLCSLFGKFAQKGERWEVRHGHPRRYQWRTWTETEYDTGLTRCFRDVAGIVQERVQSELPRWSFPAISAFVTANGREYMRMIKEQLPYRGILYQATDGWIVTGGTLRLMRRLKLVEEGVLGAFQVKGEAPHCTIFGPNHYLWGEEEIASGWTTKRVWHESETGDHEKSGWVYWRWDRIKTILSRKPDGFVQIVASSCSEGQKNPKGKVLEDGWIRPYNLVEGLVME